MHINPDHYLETPSGRRLTAHRNKIAWIKCLRDLVQAVKTNNYFKKIYILIGCQASGKSTWAKNKVTEENNVIIFDAILVKQSERKAIIKFAQKYQISCTAIWLQSSLNTCLVRNRLRPLDQQVNENGLINVFKALEAPTLEEGFSSIIKIA